MQHYNDYWFQSRDGLKLYARDYPREDSTGSHATGQDEATIVCIPGLTRNSADFDLLSQHFTRQFRVIAVDLRGRGKSDYDANPHNYHPGVYVEDIVSLFDSLELTSVNLIGTSLGGIVSMLLTTLLPEKIASIVLNDIGPEASPEGLDRIRSYVSNRTVVETWDQANALTSELLGVQYPRFTCDDWKTFTRNIYAETENGKPRLNYDAAISIPLEPDQSAPTTVNLWPVFAKMCSIPTLLVRGELSDILTQNCVTKMRDVHPKMRYLEVKDCGHAPLLTEAESLQAIEQFLS